MDQLELNAMKVLCKLHLMSVVAAVSMRAFETWSGVVEKVVFSADGSQGYEVGCTGGGVSRGGRDGDLLEEDATSLKWPINSWSVVGQQSRKDVW